MARGPRCRLRAGGRRARAFPDRPPCAPRAAQGCASAVPRDDRVHQYDQRGAAEAEPGRCRPRRAHPLVHPLERDGDGRPGQSRRPRSRWTHLEFRFRGDALRRRLQPLLSRADGRARWRPALHPGALRAGHLRPRLPRRTPDGVPAPWLPAGGRGRRALVVSASAIDARLLAVPDGLDGTRSLDGDLPGALHALPARSRHRRHGEAKGLGLPGRWRDGRARESRGALARRSGEARQSRLCRELQSPAARRPGAGQREDHPGTRGQLPRQRLERDQGDLGRAVGSAAREGSRRASAQADGRGRRRRVPGLSGAGRGVHAAAFLREGPRAGRHGRDDVGRRHLATEPRRPRSAQGVCGVRGGDGAHRGADRDPGQDREGIRHGRSRRGPERHAPDARHGGVRVTGLPGSLQHPDQRR